MLAAVSYTIPRQKMKGLDIQVVQNQEEENALYSTINRKQKAGLCLFMMAQRPI